MLTKQIKQLEGESKMERRSVTNNATFAAVAGAIISFVFGFFGDRLVVNNTIMKNMISYDGFSNVISNELVQTGLISDKILELESPSEQITAIADELNNRKNENKTLADGVQGFLDDSAAELGVTINFNKDDASSLVKALEEPLKGIRRLKDDCERKDVQLKNANDELATTKGEYAQKTWATLSRPDAVISGERLDTTIRDYMAVINNHNYYLEDFLNQFLPEQFEFDSDTIYYDKDAPEKVSVTKDMIYDTYKTVFYDGSSHFTMMRNDYQYGILNSDYWYEAYFKIACHNDYSKLGFTLGHVDDTNGGRRTLTIYIYDDKNELKELESFSLYGDMPTEYHEINIHNTSAVKIEISRSNGDESHYALANLTLIR